MSLEDQVKQWLWESDQPPVDEEPEVTFSVRLPVSDMAQLELLARYMGSKKTPYASFLLSAAIEDAIVAAYEYEQEKGRGEAFLEHMSQHHQLEDGEGWAQGTHAKALASLRGALRGDKEVS